MLLVNIRSLLQSTNANVSEIKTLSTKEKIGLFICFLPIYIVSTLFRITTFVLLFTYLNVWAFCPMIISWILNIAYAKRTRIDPEKGNTEYAQKNSRNLLAATAAVFIPNGLVDFFTGNNVSLE